MAPASKISLSWLSLGLTVGTYAASLTDYAPSFTPCPETALVRTFSSSNQTLSADESSFISARESNVIPANWQSWLGNGSDIGYDTSAFVGHYARLGVAFSGGGDRASQFEAGVLSAFDSRNATATAAGTGGLIQVASYLSGLSGGAWFTSALYMNDFPTVPDMVFGSQPGWTLQEDLLLPGIGVETLEYYDAISQSIDAKAAKGFNITVADAWARMLSYHFLNGTNTSNFFDTSSHGAGQLWSQIADMSSFASSQVPFPFVVVNTNGTIDPTTEILDITRTVYEISPFEFASFDPDVSAAAVLPFIGTSMFEGSPVNSSTCVIGFDQAGFVIGTSSNIFPDLLVSGEGAEVELLQSLLGAPVGEQLVEQTVVSKWPNPFHGIATSTFADSGNVELELLDGGTNGENVPLNPLLVKARGLDVIVAVDASADTNQSWPDGSALLITAERASTLLVDSHQQLPDMPNSTAEFVAQGLNLRPTFFGCDSTQTPLIIWIPNAPPLTGDAPFTNAPTTQTQFELNETQVILNQAYDNTVGGFVPNTNYPDPNWGNCLKCAAVDRSRSNVEPAIERSAFCTQCFQQYCYNPANLTSVASLPNRKLTYAGP